MVVNRARWMFVGLIAVVAACHSSSSAPEKTQDPPAPEKPPEAVPPAPAAPEPTDGKNPCEQLRPLLVEVDRDALDHDAWTKAKSEAQKRMALDEGVEAAIAVCVSDHWTAQTIRCILDSKDGTAQERCGLSHDEDRRADAATEAVYTRVFGPHP